MEKFIIFMKEIINNEIYDMRIDTAKCYIDSSILIIRKSDIINICELYDNEYIEKKKALEDFF